MFFYLNSKKKLDELMENILVLKYLFNLKNKLKKTKKKSAFLGLLKSISKLSNKKLICSSVLFNLSFEYTKCSNDLSQIILGFDFYLKIDRSW